MNKLNNNRIQLETLPYKIVKTTEDYLLILKKIDTDRQLKEIMLAEKYYKNKDLSELEKEKFTKITLGNKFVIDYADIEAYGDTKDVLSYLKKLQKSYPFTKEVNDEFANMHKTINKILTENEFITIHGGYNHENNTCSSVKNYKNKVVGTITQISNPIKYFIYCIGRIGNPDNVIMFKIKPSKYGTFKERETRNI